jgi:hypothetical protein
MTDLWQQAIDHAERGLRGDTGARRIAASAAVALSRAPDLFRRSHPGRDLAYLVALLEALGLVEESRALLRSVVSQLQWDPKSLALPGDVRNELAVILIDRGLISSAVGVLSTAVVLGTQDDAGGAAAKRVANLSSVKLRLGDLTGATSAAEEALSLGAGDDSLQEQERMEIRLLAESVLAEATRQQGHHREADQRVHAVALTARGLVRLLGGDHPKSLSALITVARAQFGSALAAGDRERWEQAADVLSIAAQKVSAVLGPRHPLSRSALVNLATAECEAAQTLDDERRLERARLMLVSVIEHSEGERRTTPAPVSPPAAIREADRSAGPPLGSGSQSNFEGTADSAPPPPHTPNPPPRAGRTNRMPPFGYDRPGSSSPDYTSPDFGGPSADLLFGGAAESTSPPPRTSNPPPTARRRPESQGGSPTGHRRKRTYSVPQHLLSEDREDYERVLDEALRSAPNRPELSAVGQRFNPEQLRTMALNATALITVAAATEYQHYVKVREELRQPAPSTRESGSVESGTGTMGLAATLGEAAEPAGAGAVAVAAVLTPVLAGTAAAIFLLVGYILKMFNPEPAFTQTMVTAGWVFGAVAVAAALVTIVGLVLAAVRNRPSLESGPYGELSGEVARAREAWLEALLERGIMPFLREALADPGAAAALHSTTPQTSTSRIPHLGYDRPGFSSPDDGSSWGSRPSFTSPDYTSPDFGGSEQQPE